MAPILHARRRRPGQQYEHFQNQQINTSTDYESDTAYNSDMARAPLPQRSNEEVNLKVLKRYNPDLVDIISLANYAVIYTFNPTTAGWEKINIEGATFVCSMTPGPLGEERYEVFTMNRRCLDNFHIRLTAGENVEITDEFIILKEDQDSADGNSSADKYRVYGIWIYSEDKTSTVAMRAVNAKVIMECSTRAGQSLQNAKERIQAMRQEELHVAAAMAGTQAGPTEEVGGAVPMGRAMSLREIFGQQRAQDDEWSVRAHHEQPQYNIPPEADPYAQLRPGIDFQAQAPMAQPPARAPRPPAPGQPDILGDLFRRAGLHPE
ncbi:Dcp1-like decapping [Penicillium lividum]|nr:Dcp1-like decapping [Penicillium lividum]